MVKIAKLLLVTLLFSGGIANIATANQKEEALSDSVKTSLRGAISQVGPGTLFFDTPQEEQAWLQEMSRRLDKILPSDSILRHPKTQKDFLTAVHYEATRAGLSPQLVLAVIHVESAFRQHAISSAYARGYMQVMPFWVDYIGDTEHHSLFALRTNLRYGCVILRHYLDVEKGDVVRALARYNGSLGKTTYPDLVFKKYHKHWQITEDGGQ